MTGVLLLLAPAIVMALLLVFGRYPGARVLARVLERRRPRRRRTGEIRSSLPRPDRRRSPRGGALLALALAGRAPPRLVA